MFKNAVTLLLFLSLQCINAQIKLTHNLGDNLVETGMISCEEDESWARVFNLSDFGVTTNEQFIIRSGQVGISKSFSGAYLGFAIYSVDSNFPNSKPFLLASGGYKLLPHIEGAPQIIQFDFSQPFVVPAGVERILVEVGKIVDFYNPNSAEVIIAGTAEDTGDSWYKGCRKYYSHTSTTDLEVPVPDANFYINVTGEKFNISNTGAVTTLSHNYCDNIIKTMDHSCGNSFIYYARDFYLNDFGISADEELVISKGQIGITYADGGPTVQFNFYEIDDNFPASFSNAKLLGQSQEQVLPYIMYSNSIVSEYQRIISIDFDNDIVIPATVKRILVEVKKGLSGGTGIMHVAGTLTDDGASSWYKGCLAGPNYINTDDFTYYPNWPGENYNFYINVTGKVNHVSNNFAMNITNICSEFLKEFSVEKKSEVASIIWNFGDPASGVNNTSTDLSPYHDFSADGTYTITATVTAKNGSVDVLTETIQVKEPPTAYGINNIVVCEDSFGTGISSSFDTSNILAQVLGVQTGRVVTYIDGMGKEYNVLPNPFTNTIKDRETITVRVSRSEALCCYSEITFDLIVNPLPDLSIIQDILACDDDNDGFTTFNLTQIQSDLSANNTNVAFYFQDGQQISNAQLNAVINKVQTQETITVKVINTLTSCENETTFKLIVNPLPIANLLQVITGCDDNNDGISEYFDTSTIETDVLNGQTGMVVSYYNEFGNQLASPLPNPYTNTKATQETITVRVTNPQTGCYAETFLKLTTSAKPLINQPLPLYSCYKESGIAFFNTSTIEHQLIGNQTGLRIFYSDENGMALPSPLPANYQNTKAWSQKINVRVENQLNPRCYSETSFNLNVNELPKINLENDYFLCDLEPSLYIATNSNFDSWKWTFEDGTVISNSFEANLTAAGSYTLKITKINNGISCENSFSFNLVRSILPIIDEVKIQDISANNSIEIITSGDGDFEYSIDGFNYQDDNIFQNLFGGVYQVQVRDKKGCGLDDKEVVLVDYPKFFTPNNDGFNDYWQIKGIEKFPNTVIYIFDRFGKLLKQLTFKDLGWNGTYNGQAMFASDYWFTADLGDGRTFKGHFSLKR